MRASPPTRLTGKKPGAGRGGSRIFRPGRDSDSAYQGLGIPFFSIGVPGPAEGHADVDAAGRIAYWHAPDDTFDKLDMKALELDTQYRVAQLYDLATVRRAASPAGADRGRLRGGAQGAAPERRRASSTCRRP